jgi:hypothetical protein
MFGVGLGHLDITPLMYGLGIFFGLATMWHKLITFQWVALSIEIAVFYTVFKLHGGTMAGGFAATIAALLAGFIFPWMLRRR